MITDWLWVSSVQTDNCFLFKYVLAYFKTFVFRVIGQIQNVVVNYKKNDCTLSALCPAQLHESLSASLNP